MTTTLIKIIIHSINNKGAIFSLDALISFSITLVILLLFISTVTQNYSAQKENLLNYYLEEKTLMVIDSLVKNNNPENFLLGACITDTDKKRIKSNELSLLQLTNVKPFELKEFFVKQITWKDNVKLLSEKESHNCITMQRFVLIDSERDIILLTGCLSE